MNFSRAIVTIKGTAPYTQSHQHAEPKLEGEQPEAYDIRTWRSKMNVEDINGKKTVVIPAFGLHCAIMDAAQYSGRKIVGQKNATWTKKFQRGIAVMGASPLNISPDEVSCLAISVNADGKRGSGTRVTRRFPSIPMGWKASFEVMILDPIITETVFREMVELAGLFIGVGQHRPQNGGSNGRFIIENLVWEDNRQKAA